MAVIAQASTHDLDALRCALTEDMFGYLRETQGLGKGDHRRLNTQRASWVAAIDAEVDRQH